MMGQVKPLSKLELKNDRVLEYNSMIYKISHMITEIKDAGFETLKFEDRLKKIQQDVLSFQAQSFAKNMRDSSDLAIDFSRGLEELKKLEDGLSIYNMYVMAVATCRYIVSNLDKDTCQEKISEYADSIISVLSNLKKLSSSYIEVEDKINKEIYEVGYSLIKLELMITGKSKIYEYAKKSDVDKFIFDKLVYEDFNDIDTNLEDALMIKRKIYEIKKLGIDSSYFDLELIKLIVIYKDSSYKENIVLRIEKLISELKEHINSLDLELDNISDISETIKIRNRDASKYVLNLSLRIMSLVVSVILFALGEFGVVKLSKSTAMYGKYQKNALIYEDLTETLSSSEEEVEIYNERTDDVDKTVTVTVYGSWNTNSKGDKTNRSVKIYDLSDVTLDSIYEYVNSDLLVFKNLKSSEKIKYNYEDDDKYMQEYIEVELADYTYLDEEIMDNDEYISGIIVFNLLYAVLNFVMYMLFTGVFENSLCFDEVFSEISCDIKEIKEKNKKNKKSILSIKNKLKEMLDIIYANEELKLEFERLFEENKFLLNDPDELMKRFNRLKTEEIDKKVRTLSKKYRVK